MTVLTVNHVSKSFDRGSKVLKGLTFSIGQGEMVALIGASGSGKSTLIRAIAGLIPIDKSKEPGAGEILLFGAPMQRNGKVTRQAKALRVRTGVVFQQFNLVPRLSVLTNVCIGLLGQIGSVRGTLGFFTPREKRKALSALQRVGIVEQAMKPGSQLSGGQQQRAAIARTLVQGAELLIADEPIASLDPSSARRVMDILAELNAHDGITILVSLHQVEYAIKYCPRTIALRAGEVVYDGPSTALTRSFLTSLYGEESTELFVPGFDRFGRQDPEPAEKVRALDTRRYANSNAFLTSEDAASLGAS